MADKFSHHLNGDPEVYENPKSGLCKKRHSGTDTILF